jgi:hypothetical protein
MLPAAGLFPVPTYRLFAASGKSSATPVRDPVHKRVVISFDPEFLIACSTHKTLDFQFKISDIDVLLRTKARLRLVQEEMLKLNDGIRAETVNVMDSTGNKLGVMPRAQALMQAKQQGSLNIYFFIYTLLESI